MPYSENVIEKYERERERFRARVEKSVAEDREFLLDDDAPLTDEEIAQIDAFWSKYTFAYPEVDYESYRAFKNRLGYLDVRHLPNNVRKNYFETQESWRDNKLMPAFRHKAYQDMIYANLNRPETVARRMRGIYYDSDYNPITLDDVIELCIAKLAEGPLIVKPGTLSGGKGIQFLDASTAKPDAIKAVLTKDIKASSSFVIQRTLTQSSTMARFNPSSVNTIRVNTLLPEHEPHVISAIVRVGSPGSHVDNWHSGGSLVGIDLATGICRHQAITNDIRHITTLPSGLDLTEDIAIPNFEAIKELVVEAHYRIPYFKLVGWDIALDENDTPVFIEANFGSSMSVAWSVNGAIYGEHLEGLLDKYLLKDFHLTFATEQFICWEFHDHIEIDDCADGDVTAPKTLRGKPVTKIHAKAKKKNVKPAKTAKSVLRSILK